MKKFTVTFDLGSGVKKATLSAHSFVAANAKAMKVIPHWKGFILDIAESRGANHKPLTTLMKELSS